MKLSSSALTKIAAAAGITATLSTADAARLAPEAESSKPSPPQKCEIAPPNQMIKQIFANADTNKDGKLSPEEFNKAYAAIVAIEQAKAVAKPHPVRPMPPINGDDCPGCGLG